jgi:hypothetical protein
MTTSALPNGLCLALFGLAVSLLPIPAQAQTGNPPAALVLQGGTLIDGSGREPLENAVVVIEGNRIKAVGKQGEVTVPAGSRLVDMKGKTLLPGYIDGHCHLADFMGEIYLNLGVTTCPDITTNSDDWTMAQRDGTAMGKIRGPRIWSTGARLVGAPPSWARGGTERGYLVRTPEEGRAAVRKKKELGLDILKLNEYVAPDVARAVADEAKKVGLPLTCHCLDVFLAAEADFAGVEHHWALGMTSISLDKKMQTHEQRMTGTIVTSDLPYRYQTENFDGIVQAMAAKKVSWSPTIATWFRPLSPSAARFKERETSIVDDPNTVYLPPYQREQTLAQYDRYEKYSPERREWAQVGYEKIQDLIRRFVKAGGIIRAGSDPNNGLPGLGVLEEMTMFVEAGLTPMQAIQAGTINVAKAFRKDKDFGSVEVGKVADIVAIEGDPLKDIWAVQNVKMVIKDGEIVDREFHKDYRNPIPNVRPWRPTPREIKVSPASVSEGTEPQTITVTTTGNTQLNRFHQVSVNGVLLETRFVSKTQLEAVIPQAILNNPGTYPVQVISPGDFTSNSAVSYMIVSFKK